MLPRVLEMRLNPRLVGGTPAKKLICPEPRAIAFPMLDYAKLLLAFVVVEIHTKPLMSLGSTAINRVVDGLDCVAVPFFFIASGFLCFKGLVSEDFDVAESRASRRVRSTIKKLFQLYATWFLILVPLNLIGASATDQSVVGFIASEIRGFLFVGSGVYSWPLWYLLASVVGFALVYFMLRKGLKPSLILVVSAIAMLTGFAISCLHEWEDAPRAIASMVDAYYLVFTNVRNGVFEGFFYIALGAFLGMRWNTVVGLHPAISAVLAFIGALGCIAVSYDAHLPFCAAFATGVFTLSVHKVDNESSNVAVTARNSSTIIYLVHMVFVVICVYGVFGWQGIWTPTADYPHALLFAFVSACSIGVAAIVVLLSKRHKVIKRLFGL